MDNTNRPSGIIAPAQNLLNGLVRPETRSQFYNHVSAFVTTKPILATFLAIQLLLSTTPILLFVSFAVGALVLGLVFALFWIGVALLLLLPTLFFTVSLGIAAWIWLVSSFLVARWVYDCVPVKVRGEAEIALPNGKKTVVTKSGEGYGDLKAENGI